MHNFSSSPQDESEWTPLFDTTPLPAPVEPIDLLGVRIHPVHLHELLDYISRTIAEDRRAIVTNVNVRAMNLAYEQPWFREYLNTSALVFCDGFGVKWGAALVGRHLPERMTPPDWLPDLARLAAQQRWRVYLLGARPGIASEAAIALQRDEAARGLFVVGTHHGYFHKRRESAENRAVVAHINSVRPHLLLVGFGMPLQERWLYENWHDLHVNVALPVGAAFDYLAGVVPRAPRWMTDHGLEWLGRLLIEPRRLWRRYLIGNPLFLWRLLRWSMFSSSR